MVNSNSHVTIQPVYSVDKALVEMQVWIRLKNDR